MRDNCEVAPGVFLDKRVHSLTDARLRLYRSFPSSEADVGYSEETIGGGLEFGGWQETGRTAIILTKARFDPDRYATSGSEDLCGVARLLFGTAADVADTSEGLRHREGRGALAAPGAQTPVDDGGLGIDDHFGVGDDDKFRHLFW